MSRRRRRRRYYNLNFFHLFTDYIIIESRINTRLMYVCVCVCAYTRRYNNKENAMCISTPHPLHKHARRVINLCICGGARSNDREAERQRQRQRESIKI